MIGGWSGKPFRGWESSGIDGYGFGCPRFSLLWELENAIRDSELSGNLAHELPPLPGPRCNFVPLDAPILS